MNIIKYEYIIVIIQFRWISLPNKIIVFPVSLINYFIRFINHFTFSISFIVFKFSYIDFNYSFSYIHRSIYLSLFSLSMHFIIQPISFVFPIIILKFSFSIAFSIQHFTTINTIVIQNSTMNIIILDNNTLTIVDIMFV